MVQKAGVLLCAAAGEAGPGADQPRTLEQNSGAS